LDPPGPQTASNVKDAAFVQDKLLQRLVEEGEEMLFVMLSYGGSLGSAAAKNLSVRERKQQGLKGRVIGQVIIAAYGD